MGMRLFLENRDSEIRWALRSIRRDPGPSALAMLSLALGIGANTAIFSLVNAVLLKRLPVRSLQELHLVAADPSSPRVSWNYPDYLAFRDRTTGFSGLAAASGVGTYGMQAAERGTSAVAELVQNQLVLGDAVALVAIGTVIGLGAAIGLSRLIASLLYGVSPQDPHTMAGAAAVLGLVTLLAVAAPVDRVLRVHPNPALRYE